MTPKPPASKSHQARFAIGGLLALALLGGGIWVVSPKTEPPSSLAKTPETPFPKVFPIPQPLPEPKVEPPREPDQPKEKEMVIQEKVEDVEPVAQPSPPPISEPISTTIEGPGELSLGSGGDGGPGGPGELTIGSPRKGGKWDYYAAKVQQTIKETLANNPNTKSSSFSMNVRVWADAEGRITRADLVGSSGNTTIDDAIKSQVLTGQMLPLPPPADMPMPINMRISARKSI